MENIEATGIKMSSDQAQLEIDSSLLHEGQPDTQSDHQDDQAIVSDQLERQEEQKPSPRLEINGHVDDSRDDEFGGLEMPDVHVLLDMKERTIQRLQDDLRVAQLELKTKDEKCGRLEEMQSKVDSEIHDLTASLFQEAYRMVQEANEKRATSQKLLNEANGKIDVLEAEVDALKTLVITSTPSAPNKHLFPHLSSRNDPGSRQVKSADKEKRSHAFFGHKRNYSDSTNSVSGSTTTNSDEEPVIEQRPLSHWQQQPEYREIDPVYHQEFVSWREKLDPADKAHPFLHRIYKEDILPCLNFANAELARAVLEAIEGNRIIIEQVVHDERTRATNCVLSDVPRVCNYRLKLENRDVSSNDDGVGNGGQQWLFISTLCRNRIAAACNFMTYLRYLNQGLVKASVTDAYWEIIRLRRCMALARLGYDLDAF